MKKILFISKTILSIALIATVVSVAHAWTAPTSTPTGGNVPAPVNTGSIAQTKNSDLSLVGNLMAFRGFFSQYINAPKARFGCLLFSCGSASFISPNIFEAGAYNNGVAFDKGLVVHADGGIQITSGNPGAGKVLTSDATGNASWGAGAVAQTQTLDMYEAVHTENNDSGHVTCNPGYKVTGGGGNCGNVGGVNEAILVSEPTGIGSGQEGWWINCTSSTHRTITTRAICMKMSSTSGTPVNGMVVSSTIGPGTSSGHPLCNYTATVTVTVTGGQAPYVYSLYGNSVSSSNTTAQLTYAATQASFAQVANIYPTVKDANGVMATSNQLTVAIPVCN